MILITGATGNVGKELVKELLQEGQRVRVFTRDAGKVADLAGKVEVAVGDLDRVETVETAMQDVERCFLVTGSTQQDRNALEAAKKTGLGHIVKLSTIEAGHEPMIGHGKFHREREELIRASGLSWTFLRPTMFMTNAFQWASTIKTQSCFYYPGGEGKVSGVDPLDVAAVAAAALTKSGFEGQAYALTGPEALSFGEMAQVIGRVLGRPVRYVDMPESAAGEEMRKAGVPEHAVQGLMEAFAAIRKGRFAYCTDAVEQATGRPARTFETWFRENMSAFQ